MLAALAMGDIVDQVSAVLVYVGFALFLALGLDPMVMWIEKKLPRAAAVTIVAIGVILAFGAVMLAIVPVVVREVGRLIEDGPRLVEDLIDSDWFADVSGLLGPSVMDAANSLLDFVQDPENFLAIGGGVFAVGAGITGGVVNVTIVLILTLFFMASLRGMKRTAARFFPAYQRETFSDLVQDVSGAVGRYVIGQLSLALINGILSLIFLTIVGAPLPALLALLAFVGSMIPLVGTLIASIINSLVCLFVSPVTALITIGYYLVYMQIEAYVLSPRIMSRAVSVPGALVIIAAVAGGVIGNVLGAIVAIPIAASAVIIIQKVIFPAQDSKTVART